MKLKLIFSILFIFGPGLPSPAGAADCSLSWNTSPVGLCKTDCSKSGTYCDWPTDNKSWSSNSTNDCTAETAKPADPLGGHYGNPGMNCNTNSWTLYCDVGAACSNTSCPGYTPAFPCTAVNACTGACTACNAAYTFCTGTCQLTTPIAHCTTWSECTDTCSACAAGYTLTGGVCVGVTLRLSPFSVKTNQDLTQGLSTATALYVTSDLKVGISTGNPQYMLHIASGAGESGYLMAVTTGPTELFAVKGDGAHATKFWGDGSPLTDLNADNLAAGTLPPAPDC